MTFKMLKVKYNSFYFSLERLPSMSRCKSVAAKPNSYITNSVRLKNSNCLINDGLTYARRLSELESLD